MSNKRPTCHPERPYYARDRCRPCYHREYFAQRRRLPSEKCGHDGPYGGKGLCVRCYQREWQREKRKKVRKTYSRTCPCCRGRFSTRRPHQRCCDADCSRLWISIRRTKREAGEEVFISRDRATASEVARSFAARGCRVVGRGKGRVAGRRIKGPWVTAWQRGPLYVVRARLPGKYWRHRADGELLQLPPDEAVILETKQAGGADERRPDEQRRAA